MNKKPQPLVPVKKTGFKDHHLDEFRERQRERMRLAGWPVPKGKE